MTSLNLFLSTVPGASPGVAPAPPGLAAEPSPGAPRFVDLLGVGMAATPGRQAVAAPGKALPLPGPLAPVMPLIDEPAAPEPAATAAPVPPAPVLPAGERIVRRARPLPLPERAVLPTREDAADPTSDTAADEPETPDDRPERAPPETPVPVPASGHDLQPQRLRI